MDATRDDHTKWSKSEREKQILYDITYMWNLKYNTNEPIHGTDSRTQTSVAKGERTEGGMEWKAVVRRCKLLYAEWINNEVLLYSPEYYTQYPMINHNGKRIYMYV